jgi:mono/diheme cytochrome c family protein
MKTVTRTLQRKVALGVSAFWLATGLGGSCQGGEPHLAASHAAARGRTLYLMNCAHCHGVDGTGDEGPDLHDLELPDERVAKLINNGKKGEMPKFSAKLDSAQIQLLIAYLHTLK